MRFTIKNYNKPNGLSTKIFEKQQTTNYSISGPFGIGMNVQNDGVFVAFAGGTGVLTFMDLVAYIA